MKKNLPIIIVVAVVVVIAVVALLFVLPQKEYRDDISSAEIIKVAQNSFKTEGGTYENDDDKILDFTVDNTPSLIDYKIVKANNAKNINEIGVFHVESKDVNSFKKLVDDYVSNLQASY